MRILLYILLIYFAIKGLARFLLPHMVKKGMEEMERRQRQYQGQDEPQAREGEVIIDKKPGEKENDDGAGEYIDYEEVE